MRFEPCWTETTSTFLDRETVFRIEAYDTSIVESGTKAGWHQGYRFEAISGTPAPDFVVIPGLNLYINSFQYVLAGHDDELEWADISAEFQQICGLLLRVI